MESVVTFFLLLRNGLLGVLELSEKRTTPAPELWQRVARIVSLFQMLSFVVQTVKDKPWPASLSPAEVVSSLTNLKGYHRWISSGAATAAVWVGMVWVGMLLLLLSWGIWCFSKNTFPFLWPLKVLRTMGQLSSGLLFIPLLQMLLQSSCAQLQNVPACSSWGNATQIAISILLSLFLFFVALLFTGVFFEASMVSRDLTACPHGRANALLLLLQVALVLTTSTFDVTDINLRLVILFVAGAAWLVSTLYFLPYHAHDFNRYTVAGACVYLTACCCMLVNTFDPQADAGIMFWAAAPLAIGTGFSLADARANGILCTPAERLNSPYEVDVRGRLLLHAALHGHPYLRGTGAAQLAFVGELSLAGAAGAGEHGMGVAKPAASAPLHAPGTAGLAAVGNTPLAFSSSSSAFDGVGGLQSRLPPEAVRTILALYKNSLSRFNTSSMFHIFASRIYGELIGNRHMQMSHLLVRACW
jgi:hypothetical protein